MENGKRVPYVQVPAYEGPLDLLLHLIQQEKVDIYDIPIARIADQFVQAVQQLEALDMDVTSEFLVLAAQLVYLKSRLLLPKPPKEQIEVDEEDLRQELVERLVAYRSFKYAAQMLGALETSSGQRYFREVDVEELVAGIPVEDPLSGVSFEQLWQAFNKVLERAEAGEEIRHIHPEDISIEAMTKDVLRRVLLHPQGLHFRQLIRVGSRMEMVVAFLALLELLKNGKVKAEQAAQAGDIIIFPTGKAWEFAEEEE